MKTLALILTLSVTSLFANDGQFVSKIIHESDQAVEIHLSARNWMKVSNFTQNGGETTNGVNFAQIITYQGAAGLPGVIVLNASGPSTTHEHHEDLFLAGPLVVTVASVPGATVFLSYLIGKQ